MATITSSDEKFWNTQQHIRTGVTTDELDKISHAATIARDSYPSTLNYRGFPKSVCIRTGFHADLNATYPVDEVDSESLELMRSTKQALDEAMAICRPGALYRLVILLFTKISAELAKLLIAGTSETQ
ncbi:hypothetical protein QFC19_001748 [Naganishia cerealis]|uniref:Uncharacterized protein n=1 Tax=Naganishia cerealis TaxID=610337 RepID=A0ACC2WEK1_9TREE|nr:hypothetical protein QFC19_001748 [Naganishia cerealis]